MRQAPDIATQADTLLDELAQIRAQMLSLVAPFDDATLERQFNPIMSPLAWDLAHIAAYEDLWIGHRLGGHDLLRADLAATYDAFETPREVRGEIELLDARGAREYLEQVRERTTGVLTSTGAGDGEIVELVARHELQHAETMLQAMGLARIAGGLPDDMDVPRRHRPHTGLELVPVPGGRVRIGAPAHGFAYDNERPRHERRIKDFRIGRTPITNASWLSFVEGGGYERREWWTDEAWSWKQEHDIRVPLGWTEDGQQWCAGRCLPLDPGAPVIHVSSYEAEAFARAHGLRLPTEAEWERAAGWHPSGGEAEDPTGVLLGDAPGPQPAVAREGNVAPCGAIDMIGNVWEWTSTEFDGYPGFRAHPYREYSEVFFTRGYRVLRGGSFATSRRVATRTFRNWDHPYRRQIFCGVRLAADESGGPL